MLLKQGHLDQAEERCRDVLATQHRVLGRKHPDCLLTSQTLARVLAAKEEYGAARALWESTLALQREVLGAKHPETLATIATLDGLGGKGAE